MPYIHPERKKLIDGGTDKMSSGDLNYLITKLIIRYMEAKGESYKTFNDIVGALDNAKDEFRRRVLHPYEDMKLLENGDVYASRDIGSSLSTVQDIMNSVDGHGVTQMHPLDWDRIQGGYKDE